MPLTQDRMIEVLAEAKEARDYALSLHDNIGRILEIENSFMALAALRELYDHLAVPSMTRCAIEREHFAKRARANGLRCMNSRFAGAVCGCNPATGIRAKLDTAARPAV